MPDGKYRSRFKGAGNRKVLVFSMIPLKRLSRGTPKRSLPMGSLQCSNSRRSGLGGKSNEPGPDDRL